MVDTGWWLIQVTLVNPKKGDGDNNNRNPGRADRPMWAPTWVRRSQGDWKRFGKPQWLAFTAWSRTIWQSNMRPSWNEPASTGFKCPMVSSTFSGVDGNLHRHGLLQAWELVTKRCCSSFKSVAMPIRWSRVLPQSGDEQLSKNLSESPWQTRYWEANAACVTIICTKTCSYW